MKRVVCALVSGGMVSLASPLAAAPLPGEVVGKMPSSLTGTEQKPAAPAADETLAQASTTALEKEADRLVSMRNYAAALPLLQELANRLANTQNPQLLQKLERILYHLAIGQMETGRLEDAIETFRRYMEKFSEAIHARYALSFLGDCHRRLEQYDEGAEAYERLLANYTLEYQFQLDVMTKLADCYVIPHNWDKALPLLERLWKELRDSEARARAATALAQAYIEKNRVEEIFTLLPALQSRAFRARYDAEFNLTLIRGGDSMFHARRYPLALLLYQLALPKEELLRWYNLREANLLEQRKALVAARDDIKKILDLDGELQSLRLQRATLDETESYTEELRFRLGRTFYELGRPWEAFWTFWGLWRDFPESELGEEGLFAAFSLASELELYERAIELGYTYMRQFETGENYDEVTLMLGQVHIKRKEYDRAIAVYEKALAVKPEHAYFDKLTFQIGYCLFQLEDFDRALAIFTKFRKDYPESSVREACDYWTGLTYIFKKEYQSALEEFSEFVARYLGGDYYEDATFRIGVCHYGLLQFREARMQFEEFIRRFPASRLRSEAHAFLGDIAGADGRLQEAIAQYKEVEKHTTNMAQINYAAFQIGKIQEAENDYQGMIEYFQKYLRTYELRGNYTEAIWRIGFAKKQLGDVPGMLEEYFSAIKKYGNDPQAVGIDLILEDWPSQYQALHGTDAREVMEKELDLARAAGQRALELRWRMALSRLDPPGGAGRPLTEADLPFASPAVCIWIGRTVGREQPELARTAFRRVLDQFGWTEWIELALFELAELEAAQGQLKTAAQWFRRVHERFPTSERAGLAMKREADMLREQRLYKEATERYEQVLQVREWRGPLWPESLYQIGNCLLEQGRIREAFAYYQRVYVLYQHYADWTARAYLQSAACLEKLNLRQDAIRTYSEMLAMNRLRDTPEYSEAEKRLARLQ